jgi:uncharacterized membrane protein YqjE
LDRPSPRGAGPADSARALGASVLALLGARVELAAVELKEAAEQRKRLVVLAFVAAIFFNAGLMLAAFLVVVVFWETHRLPAIAGVTALYGAIAAWALSRFLGILREIPPPFGATLEEFRKDVDMIRGRDE